MDPQIIISIVVPIYKVEAFIERCARSILEQMNERVEVIFVDDSSPDESIQILQNVVNAFPDARYKIVSHEKNLGLAAARRTGIQNAVGQYVFHVDSDDYLLPGAFACFFSQLEREDYPDIILGNYMNVYRNKQIPYKRQVIGDKMELISSIITRKQSCNIWNNLIKRRLYEGMEIPPINNGEDFVTLPRLLYRSRTISYSEAITYAYTHTNTNAFQFKYKSASNRKDKSSASAYLLSYFQNVKAPFQIIQSVKFSMLLNEAIDLICATSVKQVKEVQINIEDFKRDGSKLKLSHRIFLLLRIRKMYRSLLILAAIARLLLK